MQHHFSVPFPLLHPADDEDESPSDSSHSTPRSSFFLHLETSDSNGDDDPHHRPHTLFSLDSIYFSVKGKEFSLSTYKSFSRKPSMVDVRHPLFPINGTAEGSPKREGVIKSFLRKKKRSLTASSPTDIDPFPIDLLPHRTDEPVTQLKPFPFSRSPSRSKSRNPSVHAFEELDRFVVRRGMKHHPYPRDDAPYMLAYDRTLLDNDKFSEILLRRLNHTNSPSFHVFSHASPKTILDLGCGSGGWAVEAAAFWPSSRIIGFDLLDPVRLRSGAETPSNVQWKQGNFVKYRLPFPKNTFDFVRMANLSLCVPHDRWDYVLSEVRRVLAQGGILELIDDYMYFPYSKHNLQPLTDSHDSPRVQPSSSFDDSDDEEEKDIEGKGGEEDDDEDNDEDFVSTKSRFSSLVDTDDTLSPPSYDPVLEWNRNVDNSKALETLFEDMLWRKFAIHPRPSKLFDRVLDKVFGRYHHCRLDEFNLYLAPPSSQDSDASSVGSSDSHGSAGLKRAGKDFAKWVTSADWDHHKEKRPHTKGDRSSEESSDGLTMIPDAISAKAAGRLGIKPPLPQSSPSHPGQSPGLILWPATFIPISPFELEMHACKHLHTLIGCKAALNEFLRDIARERDLAFDEQMVDDLIWDYESFRRRRFNWPSECPDSRLDSESSDPIATTPRPNTYRHSGESASAHHGRPRTGSGDMNPPLDPLFPREKLDLVRSIRVYNATKVDEEIHVP